MQEVAERCDHDLLGLLGVVLIDYSGSSVGVVEDQRYIGTVPGRAASVDGGVQGVHVYPDLASVHGALPRVSGSGLTEDAVAEQEVYGIALGICLLEQRDQSVGILFSEFVDDDLTSFLLRDSIPSDALVCEGVAFSEDRADYKRNIDGLFPESHMEGVAGELTVPVRHASGALSEPVHLGRHGPVCQCQLGEVDLLKFFDILAAEVFHHRLDTFPGLFQDFRVMQ